MKLNNIISADILKQAVLGYYGHKGNPELLARIVHHIPDGCESFADVFSGTGVVGLTAKRGGCQVYSNDIMRFARLRASVFVTYNGTPPTRDELTVLAKPNGRRNAFIQEHYGPFMGQKNSLFMDNWAANVQMLKPGPFSDIVTLLPVLAVMLKTAGNMCTMTFSPTGSLTGGRHYFDVDFEEEVFRLGLDVLPRLLFDNGRDNQVFGLDALDFITKIRPQVAYFDSPYAADGGNYEGHLAFYDKLVQVMSGEGHRIKAFYDAKADLPRYSDFVRRPAAMMNLSRLFLRAKHIPKLIVSYNTSSGISAEELAVLARAHGWRTETEFVEYHKPVTVSGNDTEMDEVIMVCAREEI